MSSTVAGGMPVLERSVGPGEIQEAVRKEARHPHLVGAVTGAFELGDLMRRPVAARASRWQYMIAPTVIPGMMHSRGSYTRISTHSG